MTSSALWFRCCVIDIKKKNQQDLHLNWSEQIIWQHVMWKEMRIIQESLVPSAGRSFEPSFALKLYCFGFTLTALMSNSSRQLYWEWKSSDKSTVLNCFKARTHSYSHSCCLRLHLFTGKTETSWKHNL